MLEPDIMSQLLKQAGDIESNPGPGICSGCHEDFSSRSRPIVCKSCKGSFHKSTCTGEKWRADKLSRQGIEWECRPCRGVGTTARRRINHNAGVEPKDCCNAKCGRKKIRAGNDFLVCSKCQSQFHKKESCSGMSREQVSRLDRKVWQCEACQGVFATPPAKAVATSAEFKTGRASKPVLNILQWNCDTLRSKVEELKIFLREKKVDIFVLQETKLIPKDETPKIHGYTLIRQDRPQLKGKEKNRGGGVLTGIKDDIPFRRVHLDIKVREDKITESITIEVPTHDGRKIRVTNVYVPPIRNTARDDRTDVFNLGKWPCTESDLILGDTNAHSSLWDDNWEGKSDKRGEAVEDWIAKGMSILNDGKPTHILRATGNLSAPDTSLAHSSLVDKITWEALTELGSDHKPIIITIGDAFSKLKSPPVYKWKLDKADWSAYAKAVDMTLPTDQELDSMSTHGVEESIRKTILKAAGSHVGKKKITITAKCWMTPEIKEGIRIRNDLGKNIGGNRQEWIGACKKVSEMIREEKSERWAEYVESIDAKTNPKEVWKTVRNLDGRRPPPNKNEVLEIDGMAYTEDKQKAEQFAKTYRAFSKLPVKKSDRRFKRKLRREMKLSVQRVPHETEEQLEMEELERTIKGLKPRKAAGTDDIPNEFIKNLGPQARKSLLRLYNRVWAGEDIPSHWQRANIKPLLKEGKDPSKTASWRPISLIDCLGKVLEKMVADRLMHILEDGGLITPNQAGFRPNRCTTDQILKLVQDATDQFNNGKTSNLTMTAFFDYAKAYDKVWREGLLHKMQVLGIPNRFVRYTRHFLSRRWTQVEINGTRSKRFLLKQGLPQGSSISPLLFLIFINDLDADLEPETVASLFADDTAVWMADGKERGSNRLPMQQEIDKVIKWADRWKMKVNADKTKAMMISTGPKDKNWDPKFTAGDTKIDNVSEYRFLGVTIDQDLRFNKHITNMMQKARKRVNILKCMSTKNWGNSVDTQRRLCIGYIISVLEYGSASWNGWISETNRKKLQTILNQALRSITNMTATCPIEFLHLEAAIEPLASRLEKNDDITRDRYARLPPEDPRHKLLVRTYPPRRKPLTTRRGWRATTEGRSRTYDVTRDVTTPPLPPWMVLRNVTFDTVQLEKAKADYTQAELKKRTLQKINELTSDIRIYTDGSTDERQMNGGAGIFIEDRDGTTLYEASFPAGEWCSSYGGECVAALRALEWVKENNIKDCSIITDSLSLQKSIETNDWKNPDNWLKEIKRMMYDMRAETTIRMLWIPSHIDIDGNERADALALTGSSMNQDQIPVTQSIVKSKIRARKWTVTHERAAPMYRERRGPKFEVERRWPRDVRRNFQQLRSGHSKLLKKYRYIIDLEDDPYCDCDMIEEETLEHVLCRCPALEEERTRQFDGEVTTTMMVTHPEICRRILQYRYRELKHCIADESRGEDEEVHLPDTGDP